MRWRFAASATRRPSRCSATAQPRQRLWRWRRPPPPQRLSLPDSNSGPHTNKRKRGARGNPREVVVQGVATALMTTGGLLLSLACAVLLEELLIGGLFRLFFAPRREPSSLPDKRSSWD